MERRERIISFKAVLKRYCIHWRSVLSVGILCALLAAGYEGLRSWPKEIAVEKAVSVDDTSAELTMIDSNINGKKNYLRESLIARIDPTNEAVASTVLSISRHQSDVEINKPDYDVSDDEIGIVALNTENASGQSNVNAQIISPDDQETIDILTYYSEYIMKSIDWKELEERLETKERYILELVSVEDYETNYLKKVILVKGADKETAQAIMEYILNSLEKAKEAATLLYGEHQIILDNQAVYTRVDSSLFGWLNTRVDEMNKLMNTRDTFKTATAASQQLNTSNTRLGYMAIIKGYIKYAVIGFFGGIILYSLLYSLYLVLKGNVLSAQEFNRQYNFAKYGVYAPESGRRKQNALDRKFALWGSEYFSGLDRQMCDAIVKENIQGKEKIGVVSDLEENEIKDVFSRITGESIVYISNPDRDADALSELKGFESVIIVAKVMKSTYSRINDILDCLEANKVRIEGSIVA